jgi:UDP-N-acetyl-D-mannosaminuronic acid dehydrogenase
MQPFDRDICIVGGGGHVGLPLAITFADCGMRTVIYDVNSAVVEKIRRGEMPFIEEGAESALQRVLARATLEAVDRPEMLARCEFIVFIIGTPVDEHLNPSFTGIHRAIDGCLDYFREGQVLILRSTVFPGISEHIQHYLRTKGINMPVAFCPERVAQGYSLREFRELPQIVSAFDPVTLEKMKKLFGLFAADLIEMSPIEAELCKLMTNAWRYIQFAAANQFYMIASSLGLNFNRILHGCRHKYPRMAGFPGPGFAAGPCLVKDTMQLAAFSQNTFVLGHSAMLINEGLPYHLIQLAKREVDLKTKTTGILGMAFKAESDDRRDSLSYKLRKSLMLESAEVLCTDPYVPDAGLLPLEEVVRRSDVLFVATPHKRYRSLVIPSGKLVIDVWNCVPTPGAGA